MIDIVGKRYWYFGLSLLVIPGLILFAGIFTWWRRR